MEHLTPRKGTKGKRQGDHLVPRKGSKGRKQGSHLEQMSSFGTYRSGSKEDNRPGTSGRPQGDHLTARPNRVVPSTGKGYSTDIPTK